jgi:hypothetical protein
MPMALDLRRLGPQMGASNHWARAHRLPIHPRSLHPHYLARPMNRTDTHLITLTMTEGHWLRIRAALLCAAEDLAQAGSDQEAQYKHSYDLVKLGLEPWINGHASTLA